MSTCAQDPKPLRARLERTRRLYAALKPYVGFLFRCYSDPYPGKVVVMSGSDPRYIQMSSTIAKTRGLAVAGTLAKPFRKQQVTDLLTRLAENSSG
jgi:hypothetical protein